MSVAAYRPIHHQSSIIRHTSYFRYDFGMRKTRRYFILYFFLWLFRYLELTIYTFRKKNITQEYVGSKSLRRGVRLDFFEAVLFSGIMSEG